MKFIKSDECHAIIEIIMALLTLISVITVGYSINEMKMQRESAYKPVLSRWLRNPSSYRELAEFAYDGLISSTAVNSDSKLVRAMMWIEL